MKMKNGMMVQDHSSQRYGSYSIGTSCPGRRRYRIAKTRMMIQTTTEASPQITHKVRKSPSTWPEVVDADSGKSGKLSNMRFPLFPDHENDEAGNPQDGCSSRDADGIHRHGAVTSGRRIVAVAQQQELIDGRADGFVRRFHQSQAQVSRRVLNAKEIPADATVRRRDDDGCPMSPLRAFCVPLEAEAQGVHECVDGSLIAGEEVPTGLRARASIVPYRGLAFFRGVC